MMSLPEPLIPVLFRIHHARSSPGWRVARASDTVLELSGSLDLPEEPHDPTPSVVADREHVEDVGHARLFANVPRGHRRANCPRRATAASVSRRLKASSVRDSAMVASALPHWNKRNRWAGTQ
jgi:hypothetical protein